MIEFILDEHIKRIFKKDYSNIDFSNKGQSFAEYTTMLEKIAEKASENFWGATISSIRVALIVQPIILQKKFDEPNKDEIIVENIMDRIISVFGKSKE